MVELLLLVIDWNVAVDQTVIVPVFAETAVSVPAVNVRTPRFVIVTVPVPESIPIELPATISETPYDPKVWGVTTGEPFEYISVAYIAPLTPTPPAITNAPVVVDVDDNVFEIIILFEVIFSILVTSWSDAILDILTVPVVEIVIPLPVVTWVKKLLTVRTGEFCA